MKVNDFKKLEEQQQLDEIALSSFIGDFGAAAVKSLFTGKGLKHQMIQDMFLKDFYEDGITSLENAVKGGLVNPNIAGNIDGGAEGGAGDEGTGADGTINPGSVTPGAGQPGGTAPAVAAKKAQQQTTQNINNYVKNAASAINKATDKNQKIALTKELVNAMADRQGTPEWNNALKGVENIIKTGGVDAGFANTAIGNLRSGKTMAEAYKIYFINKLIESVGLTWKDLGLCVLKENKNYYIAERKYIKLNSLFESIVKLDEDDGKQSISDYMLNWFNQYMTGVNWKSQQATVIPMIKAIEASYGKDKGKAAIKTLAKTAYALSKSNTSMPAGMKDELSKMKDPNAQAAAQKAGTPQGTKPAAAGGAENPSPPVTLKDIQSSVASMSPEDLTALKKSIDDAIAAKAKPAAGGTAPAGGTTPPAAPAATTESRIRRKK